MFLKYKEKRIQAIADAVNKYVASIYSESAGRDVRFSIYFNSVPNGKEETNNTDSPDLQSTPCEGVKYSLRDSYKEDTVSRLMTAYAESDDNGSLMKGLRQNTNPTFIDCVINYIDSRNLKDSSVYKAAQLDRRLFSKMMSDRDYKPAKDTALAVIFALKLPLQDAEDLLSRAGYTLSHSNRRDIIIEYFLREGLHDLNDINAVLIKLGQKKIGR